MCVSLIVMAGALQSPENQAFKLAPRIIRICYTMLSPAYLTRHCLCLNDKGDKMLSFSRSLYRRYTCLCGLTQVSLSMPPPLSPPPNLSCHTAPYDPSCFLVFQLHPLQWRNRGMKIYKNVQNFSETSQTNRSKLIQIN